MNEHLAPLDEAISRLHAAWASARDGSDLTRQQSIAANEALGQVRRLTDSLQAEVAAGISSESRASLGSNSLAKQQGFRNASQLIATTTGISAGEASRLIKVGEATAPRTDLVGDRLPARYPAVQNTLRAGLLSAAAAGLIIALLDRVRLKITPEHLAAAEKMLAEHAVSLSLDEVRKLLTRAEAWLDPDGVEPREEEAHDRRHLTMFERDGDLHFNGSLPIADGAALRAAINGSVSAEFAARENVLDPDAPDADHRTVPQMQADALIALCRHSLGCDNDAPAMAGATVVVRVGLEDLQNGTGYGTIDGSDQPISISAVRRMAASGGVIPCVLGTSGEILDWGREKRFFTRSQRLALAERDGGCAMCTLPPDMTRAHHIRWWQRDTGPTDLSNGVLLCESCHHRIHDNGWNIRIDGTGVAARVWFIPPPSVDPSRTPRLGGLARYDLAA
ncbi:HNH endonuclease signature motif containing protein [Microbacterium sp. H1-D42]|uniref:HNH endonuclease n=1 Tax=Microbacterium sp. H1-D42 TaxID=2925844 RepID=UPI001F52DBFE|nr:HNH endonuclease signature motif containing protein [Microbacterium sp. H1-D42]UNK70313.1 HNH endonuclease [Microbacterium sp. H1-D42]